MERLNKYLAESGVASRRQADNIISEGKVKVNGQVVNTMGYMVNEQNDTVTVDGVIVKPVKKYSYIMLYKLKGCITSVKDDKDRKTVYDFLQNINIKHLVPVGRLDYDTEGMLLLTNDGSLVQKLTHPSNEIPKTYLVKVKGDMPEHKLAQLRKGVTVDGVKYARCKVKLLEFAKDVSKLEVTIHEGKNREIRKMFEFVDREVTFLKRIAVGDLKLGGLARGEFRYLHEDEIEYLKKM